MSTRRSFFGHALVGAAFWQMAGFSRSSYGALAQAGPIPASSISERLSWFHEGIVSVEYMEPLEYYIRRGDAPADILQRWKQDFTDAGAKHYKDMGVNLIFMPLHKGMGLKTEADSIDATRKFTEIAHRHGIKVAGYVGSTMFYETFYGEEAGAPGWQQTDQYGNPIYYFDQTFRYAACRNNPGYRTFLEKVLRIGILDVKLDMIHFDQLLWWATSCHCKYCQDGFRSYLGKKYTDVQLRALLGFTNLEGVRVPDSNVEATSGDVRNIVELKDPLIQEWARFRCSSLAEWWGETHTYIRNLNPEVALLGNPTMEPTSNCGFVYGVDLQQLLLHGEFVSSEEENQPRWTADDRLISTIRSYKTVRSMGKSLFVQQGSGSVMEGSPNLRLAEAMAYNDLNMGLFLGGWEFGGSDRLPPQSQQYVDFFRLHQKDLADTTPVTDIAILRSFASIEFNPAKSNVSTTLFEQMLIQCKFPFGIIFDTHLKDLSKYKVLVLANQDALSDEQLERIRRFVDGGGGLVATEETSLRTEWRRKRNKFGLADMFGIDVPAGEAKDMIPIRREFGKGRVVYIPRIQPVVAPPAAKMTFNFTNQYWKLPKNYEELAEATRWASRQEFSVSVEAPLWVTMELAEQKSTSTWLLHLLNFKEERPLTNIPIRVRIPDGMRLKEVVLESPNDLPRQILVAEIREHTLYFNVPKLEVYDIVFLRMDGNKSILQDC